jgi:hypothetical protein
MIEPGTTSQDILRDDILASGHDDFVSMADVQACFFDGLLNDLSTEHQQLVVDTVRSLLEDGLAEVGDIPGRNDPGFKPWPGTVDDVMTRFVDRFVGCYDDRLQWQYTIWLNLTAKGQQASDDILAGRPIADVATVSNALEAVPAEARAVIVEELNRRDPALLAELRGGQEPTTEQSDAVNLLLAKAIIESLGPDWTPNEHGLAVEHAVTTFFEVWPRQR